MHFCLTSRPALQTIYLLLDPSIHTFSGLLRQRQQPGPEVAEQLSVYQASLKEKTRQMKAMASELNMYQAQVGGEHRPEMQVERCHEHCRGYIDKWT